jgi:hypothetical protein
LQAQGQKFSFTELAIHVAISLIAKLGNAVGQHLMVISVVSVHSAKFLFEN